MKPSNFYAVTAQVAATHPMLMLKLESTLNAAATAGLFLQIHDSAVAAAEGAAPLKVWPAAECGYKEFKRGDLTLALGCYVCLSTTSATKTLAVGANDKLDILELEFSDPERPAGTSFAGDLVSNVTGLAVWLDAAGPKKLLALEVDGTNLTTTCYVQLFGKDAPVNGDVPVGQYTIAATAVKTGADAWRFGETGRDVTDGVHDGCAVRISTTPGVLTLTGDSARIKAEYKNQ